MTALSTLNLDTQNLEPLQNIRVWGSMCLEGRGLSMKSFWSLANRGNAISFNLSMLVELEHPTHTLTRSLKSYRQ